MGLVFWVSALGVGYVYVGYPVLLAVWARRRVRGRSAPSPDATRRPNLPRVSIVIAARNEAARLPARIDNLLAPRLPGRPARKIIVVSDGSTDDTLDRAVPVRRSRSAWPRPATARRPR